jgi:hypothetical protein
MLIDAVAKERQQILEEGREEGEALATMRMLKQILQKKFETVRICV